MTITTQKIHSVLRNSGAQKSKYISSGRVRGYGYWTTGYTVEKITYGVIAISHYIKDGVHRYDPEELADIRINTLKKYQLTLLSAGINCYPNTQETMLIVGEE